VEPSLSEPDYAVYLIRAEDAMKSVYPAMAERKYNAAALHVFEVLAQLSAFLKFLASRKK
jgi:hypothetical protein